MRIDPLTLISGVPVDVYGIKVRQPTLRDICVMGRERYNEQLSLFAITPKSFFESIGFGSEYEALPEDEKNELTAYKLVLTSESLRAEFQSALDYFLVGHSVFNEEAFIFSVVQDDSVIDVDETLYIHLCNTILEVNMMKPASEAPPKFASQKAKEIYEKIKANRKKVMSDKPTKPDKNMELSNLISAISSRHPTYNLLNIWDLTIYQFYDQFQRICVQVQVDVYAQKWAAWGDKDFDFTMWYKNHKTK